MKTVFTIALLSLLTACASKNAAPTNTAATASPTANAVAPSATAPAEKSADKKATKHDKHHAKADAKAATDKTTKADTAAKTEVNCKAGADERKLAIVVKDAGCELQYTKAGSTTVKATQINGSEKCEEVMTQIKEKLVAAKFECQ